MLPSGRDAPPEPGQQREAMKMRITCIRCTKPFVVSC
jgi:hypothetical protein